MTIYTSSEGTNLNTLNTIVPKRLSCPAHGEHDAIMYSRIRDKADPAQWIETAYCMHCMTAAWERIGIHQMTPVKDGPALKKADW